MIVHHWWKTKCFHINKKLRYYSKAILLFRIMTAWTLTRHDGMKSASRLTSKSYLLKKSRANYGYVLVGSNCHSQLCYLWQGSFTLTLKRYLSQDVTIGNPVTIPQVFRDWLHRPIFSALKSLQFASLSQ